MPPKKRFPSRSDPHQPLPKLKPTPKLFKERLSQADSSKRAAAQRAKIKDEQDDRRRHWLSKHDQAVERARKQRQYELNEMEKFNSLPDDLQDPTLYEHPFTSEDPAALFDSHITNERRRQIIEKYTSKDGNWAKLDGLNERDRENVAERLAQAKKMQFIAESGIPLDETNEENRAFEVWNQRDVQKKRQVAQDHLAVLRQRAIQKEEKSRLDGLRRHQLGLQNPDNIDLIQAEVASQRRQQISQYQERKKKAQQEQDEFMTKFRQKQRFRQALLELNLDDEEFDEMIKGGEHLSHKEEGEDRYDNDDDDDTLAPINETSTTLGKLRRQMNAKKPLALEHITDVYSRAQERVQTNKVTAANSPDEREKMLTNLRTELGIIPLRESDTKDLQDHAVRRLNQNLSTRKQKLKEQLEFNNQQQIKNIRRKPDGSEDLAPYLSSEDTQSQLLDLTQLKLFDTPSSHQIRPHRKQIYAPVVIAPPHDLNKSDFDLKNIIDPDHDDDDDDDDNDHYHHDSSIRNKKKTVETDELSVLQKHLGMKTIDRSEAEVRRKNKAMKKYKPNRVYNHLKSKLTAKGPPKMVKHPNTGELVPRQSLSYLHRVKADIYDEFTQKHAALDNMTPEQRKLHFRAHARTEKELPRSIRHELKTRQIFGPPLINLENDEGGANSTLERVFFNVHSQAVVASGDPIPLTTHQRSDPDPSDWTTDKLRDDLKLLAPDFRKHVDPETQRRGIHILHHDSKVHLPKPHFDPEIKLADGMTLKVPPHLFTQKFDEKLDKTRNVWSLLAHERPKHERDGGYLLDADGNDISHKNIHADPDDVDNVTKFNNTYGQTPTKYTSLVYKDVLGDTLLQKSRQFMHHVDNVSYSRPFSSLVSKFKTNDGIEQGRDGDEHLKHGHKYHYDYSNDDNIDTPPSSTPFRSTKPQNSVFDLIPNSIVTMFRHSTESDPDLTDFRYSTPVSIRDNDTLSSQTTTTRMLSQLSKSSDKHFNSTSHDHHNNNNNTQINPHLAMPKDVLQRQHALINENNNSNDLSTSTSFKLQAHFAPQVQRLVSNSFEPISSKASSIYKQTQSFITNLITTNQQNTQIPTHSVAAYTMNSYNQIPTALQSHLPGGLSQQSQFNPKYAPTRREYQVLQELNQEIDQNNSNTASNDNHYLKNTSISDNDTTPNQKNPIFGPLSRLQKAFSQTLPAMSNTQSQSKPISQSINPSLPSSSTLLQSPSSTTTSLFGPGILFNSQDSHNAGQNKADVEHQNDTYPRDSSILTTIKQRQSHSKQQNHLRNIQPSDSSTPLSQQQYYQSLSPL